MTETENGSESTTEKNSESIAVLVPYEPSEKSLAISNDVEPLSNSYLRSAANLCLDSMKSLKEKEMNSKNVKSICELAGSIANLVMVQIESNKWSK